MISHQEPLKLLFQHILHIRVATLIVAVSVNICGAQEAHCLLPKKKKSLQFQMPAESPLYLTDHLLEVRAQMFSIEKLSFEGYNQLLCFKVPTFLC